MENFIVRPQSSRKGVETDRSVCIIWRRSFEAACREKSAVDGQDLATRIARIEAIEQIHQLKARYFRFLDEKDWDNWAQVFTEDCRLQHGETSEDVIQGRTAIIQSVSQSLDGSVTFHQGHMPEIIITGPGSAEGIWSLQGGSVPVEASGQLPRTAYGRYFETYRKDAAGAWRIASLRLKYWLWIADERQLPSTSAHVVIMNS
jgi:hypothetical protein